MSVVYVEIVRVHLVRFKTNIANKISLRTLAIKNVIIYYRVLDTIPWYYPNNQVL